MAKRQHPGAGCRRVLAVMLMSGWLAGTVAFAADDRPVQEATALAWHFDTQTRALPLLDAMFRTALSPEPLRLYRYDANLALAVGRGVIFRTDARLHPDAQAQIAALGLQDTTALADWADGRLLFARVSSIEQLAAALAALEGIPGVRWAQPDALKVPLGGAPQRPVSPYYDLAGYSLTDDLQLGAAHAISTGRGVKVAIIDAGFDRSRLEQAGVAMPFAYDTQSRSADVSPRQRSEWHGTGVAGLVFSKGRDGAPLGVAPDATLIAIRIATTWTSDLVAAFQEADHAGADVINCSWDDPLVLQPLADVLQQISRRRGQRRGVLVVVAAGNPAADTTGWPSLSNRDEVISVTALDHHGQPIAAYGSGTDIAAPSMLPTLAANGKSQAYLGKTSAAAPVVSATLALLLSAKPSLDAESARAALLATATPVAAAVEFGKVAPLAALKRSISGGKDKP